MAKKRKRLIGALLIAGLIIIVGTVTAMMYGADAADGSSDMPTFIVQRGPLTISIDVSGTIKAQDMEVIKNEVEGRTIIISLIEEGAHVEKGDVLAVLDSSDLEDQLLNQQIAVQSAETALVSATENLAVGENQAKADIELSELTLQFAKQDLQKYIDDEGEYQTELTDAKSQIAVKQEAAQQAKDRYEWSQKLFAEKYISETELKADELTWQKAELDVTLARNRLKLLQDFTYKRNLAQYESDVSQAEMALERTKRKASANVVQYKAELLAAEEKLKRQKMLLNKLEQNISKTTIKAPAGGMVVYATSNRGGGPRGNQEPLDVGQEVYERQELIHLPTSNKVKAEVKIHESSLEKVEVGLPVVVTVDSVKDRVFQGKVSKIALLPDATMAWLNPDLKVYLTEINLEGDGDGLRTGMSCRASIIVQEYADVTFAPVHSVVRVGNQPTVYVLEGGKMKPRSVEIGLDNNRMVHITKGLEEGEKVVLNPPLGDTETEDLQNRLQEIRQQGFPEGAVPSENRDSGAFPTGSGSRQRSNRMGEGSSPSQGGTPSGAERPQGFRPGSRGQDQDQGPGQGGAPTGEGRRFQGQRPSGMRPEGGTERSQRPAGTRERSQQPPSGTENPNP
ncbi:MAG: HlyD family efflux transporter periplasmic adaptor subunit [Sedimentisphaerales bacterium]|nr:HlyD family efflux transporter periplasmic adaptor subunit [Sedimentisphaerales bacterium]